ncbi:MAG: hypothetical protein WDK96_00485 [Candidatus Paceibacterota bacterium]|jgi:hypothetical protein
MEATRNNTMGMVLCTAIKTEWYVAGKILVELKNNDLKQANRLIKKFRSYYKDYLSFLESE